VFHFVFVIVYYIDLQADLFSCTAARVFNKLTYLPTYLELSRGCVDQTWRVHRAIIAALHFCLDSLFGYLAAFSNAGGSKLSENVAKFVSRFLTPGENYEKGGGDLYTSC